MNIGTNLRITARKWGAPQTITDREIPQFVAHAVITREFNRYGLKSPRPHAVIQRCAEHVLDKGVSAHVVRVLIEHTARACLGKPKPHLRRRNGIWIEFKRSRKEIA